MRRSCNGADEDESFHGKTPPVIKRPCWNAWSLTSILGVESRTLPGSGCKTTAISSHFSIVKPICVVCIDLCNETMEEAAASVLSHAFADPI